jgi:ferredoxin
MASGQCVLIAPEIFDQTENDGTVVLLDESPAPGYQDSVRKSVLMCPAAAIRLTE